MEHEQDPAQSLPVRHPRPPASSFDAGTGTGNNGTTGGRRPQFGRDDGDEGLAAPVGREVGRPGRVGLPHGATREVEAET
ncbi:hypothetical protein ACFXA9_15380, partial [Streptomyces sp. NPDC059411]